MVVNNLKQLSSQFRVYACFAAAVLAAVSLLLLLNKPRVTENVLRRFAHKLHKFFNVKNVICEFLVSPKSGMMTLHHTDTHTHRQTWKHTHKHTDTHAHTWFLFNRPIFPKLLKITLLVRSIRKSILLEVVVTELLQAGCPSCHPTNSIKALKDNTDTHTQCTPLKWQFPVEPRLANYPFNFPSLFAPNLCII